MSWKTLGTLLQPQEKEEGVCGTQPDDSCYDSHELRTALWGGMEGFNGRPSLGQGDYRRAAGGKLKQT